MSAYWRGFDETKYMSFLIKDDELIERYNEILEKVEKSIKKEFDSELMYNEKYLEAKKNLVMEKSIQVFVIIKYQKKVLSLFVY